VTSTCGIPRGAGGIPTRWNFAEGAIVRRHLSLALKHVNFHRRLIVRSSREDLRFASRNRRVSFNQLGEHSTESFNTKTQRGHVQQQDVRLLTGKNPGLNGCTNRDDFVRVNTLVWLLAKHLLDDLLNFRNTRRTTNKHDLVDLLRIETGILQCQFNRTSESRKDRFN
jgi:hypothetical protein